MTSPTLDGRRSVDYWANPETGVKFITRPHEQRGPTNHVVPAWHLVTGLSVSTAVLATLLERSAWRVGFYVEIALADVALACLANIGGCPRCRAMGRTGPGTAPQE